MKKIIFLLVFMLILCGCSVDYNLNINENNVEEIITVTFDKNDNLSDYETYQSYLSFTSETHEYKDYIKKVHVIDEYPVVNLTKTYGINEFNVTEEMLMCFSDVSIVNTEEFIDISINGKNTCYDEYGKINVNINTPFKVISENASRKNGEEYKWTIKENADLKIRISKNEFKSSSAMTVIKVIGGIVLLGCSIVCLILYKKKENN